MDKSAARRSGAQSKKSDTKRKGKAEEVTPVEEVKEVEEHKPPKKRIFLYFQLQNVLNLPKREYDLILRLKQSKGTITKLVDRYTTNTDINLSDPNTRIPAFSITIDQDSMEDLNIFSDNPLILTLYEHIVPKLFTIDEEGEGEEEEELVPGVKVTGSKGISSGGGTTTDARTATTAANSATITARAHSSDTGEEEDSMAERDEPLAQGYMDMLQFFTQKRNYKNLSVFLYPLSRNLLEALPTCKTTWLVYSIFPLLEEISFTNLAFLSLESIYNLKPELIENESELIVDLSFQSKMRNDENEFDKLKICSFTNFKNQIIADQNTSLLWENLKSVETGIIDGMCLQSGTKLTLHKLLTDLLRTEGSTINFEEISLHDDIAMICNSMHRFVMDSVMCGIFEDVIAFNQQEILVEFYRRSEPEEVLLQGLVDISVFMYPRVNACRFGVELRPPPGAKSRAPVPTASKETTKSTKGKSKAASGASGDSKRTVNSARPKEKIPFAIVNICLLTPLSEVPESISNLIENKMRKDPLKRCPPTLRSGTNIKKVERILEETYRSYDELIGILIEFIVSHEIKNTNESKNFFCCQLGNMVNKIIKLIAFDFNVRVPTKTNIEFTNLMTTVYKELEERQYNILQNCTDGNLSKCYINDIERKTKIIKYMNVIKYLFETGQDELGTYMFEKIKQNNKGNTALSFYTFIFDMEKSEYQSAKEYIDLPLKEREIHGEYFVEMLQVYIDYMERVLDEETNAEAWENLLYDVREFVEKYPQEIDFWILLYCLYRRCSYLPGISFTRWKFENMYEMPRKEMPLIPKSRWEMYNNCKMTLNTQRGQKFYETITMFLNLGAYKLAEYVFTEIAGECREAEKYFMTTTFKIFQNQVEKKYAAKTFPTDKLLQGDQIKAFQSQVNGNLDWFRENTESALKNYGRILGIKSLTDYDDFQLALLRFGHTLLARGNYQQAFEAFERCSTIDGICVIPFMGMGKAMYRMGNLEEAEKYFAESTRYEMHLPDIWGYLALINLKMGNNWKALEFWKYAKIEPHYVVSEEVLAELRTINYIDVNLYVDKPICP